MRSTRLAEKLNSLELELRSLGLWQGMPPGEEAFASQEPFCLDTMGFDQWLQWVFVARLRAMLEAGSMLPDKSEISPLAQEFFKGRSQESAKLLQLIEGIDEVLTVAE